MSTEPQQHDPRTREGDAPPAPEPAMPEGAEPPPPGVKLMSVVRWAILAVTAALAIFVWGAWALEHRAAKTTAGEVNGPRYQCPMHPQIVSNEPGECPICHMDLVPIAKDRAAAAPSADAPLKPLVILDDAGPLTFWCPMDKEVRASKPGQCPICKMALEPIPEGGDPYARDAGAHAGHAHAAGATPPGTTPPGTTPITLALDRVQSIGVRTALAEEGATATSLRVTAVVEEPEQGTAEVHVRSPGFVEQIQVAQTGVLVSAGQPLLSLYSPEILQAQQELLVTSAWTGDASVAPSAARTKLELLGMTPADIDKVIATRTPLRAISVVAPRGGYVAKKNVVLGSYVTPGATLYEIQDLSRVFVVADVFLRDMPHVKLGSEARFVPSGHAEGAATAKIDLVYPVVNALARTQRVRLQLPNAGRRFSPGQYGIVEIATPSRRAVTIPRDALVDTGSATYVFVVEAEGRYAPRTVEVSGTDRDRIVIAAGLAAGERVVSGATFLIDSESRLRASLTPSTKATPPAAPPAGGHAGHGGAP